MQMRMNLPDVASYELVQRLVQQLGLTMHMEHGPKDDALEGLRIVIVSGNPFQVDLPRRFADMQNLLAVEATKMMDTKMSMASQLNSMVGISPDWIG